MTKYLIRLIESTTEIEADTINLGQRRLWFYDKDRHLIAVFAWERVVGFEVVGCAEQQKFTDDLLHDVKTTEAKREAEVQEKGELWVSLNDALQQIKNASSTLNKTWLTFNSTRRQKQTEVALLVRRHAAELRQIEAQFSDEQKSFNTRLQSMSDEFKQLFSESKN